MQYILSEEEMNAYTANSNKDEIDILNAKLLEATETIKEFKKMFITAQIRVFKDSKDYSEEKVSILIYKENIPKQLIAIVDNSIRAKDEYTY